MGLILLLEGGGAAEILESDGTHATVQSSRPSPPGSTLTGTAEGASRPYRLKVRGCRRIEDDDKPFLIEGRFVDITRDQRAALYTYPTPTGPRKDC